MSQQETIDSPEVAENDLLTEDFKVNGCHIVSFVILICMSVFSSKFVIGSQIYPLMAAKLGWQTDAEV